MKWIRSFVIAFSLYSKIPMPGFEWKEEDMKYVLCFFPWVGAVIGACLWGWGYLCGLCRLSNICFILVGTGIPILLTGGFHVDGFMDTMDAVHSYQSRERKLEILKDSHIGAFSVIMLLLYYFIYIAAFSEIQDKKALAIVGAGFALSRCLSGIGVTVFKPAKKDGILRDLADSAESKTVLVLLILQILIIAFMMLAWSLKTGGIVLALAAGSFLYYRYFSYKEFGGVTGDTAGWFVLLCEAVVMIGAALGGKF